MIPSSEKVSVIIPCYNYGRFLNDVLNNLLNQEYPDLEIIVVNDGSTDDTIEVLKNYAEKIKVISQVNKGLSSARNAGLDEASGEYIQLLDADDLLSKDSISNRVAYMNTNANKKLIVSRNRFFYKVSNGKPVQTYRYGWPIYKNNLDIHLFNFNIAPPHAFFMRRCVIDEVGRFDISLEACEDYDYWIRALRLGFVPEFFPGDKVFYRQHEGSMSKNYIKQTYYDSLMHEKIQEVLMDKTYLHGFKRTAALFAFICGLVHTLGRINRDDDTVSTKIKNSFNWGKEQLLEAEYVKNDFELVIDLYLSQALFRAKHLYSSDGKIHAGLEDLAKWVYGSRNNKIPFGELIPKILNRDYGALEKYRLIKYRLQI